MWMTNSIGLTTRLKQHGVSVVYTYSLNQSIKDCHIVLDDQLYFFTTIFDLGKCAESLILWFKE
jgi:hypothetical protein